MLVIYSNTLYRDCLLWYYSSESSRQVCWDLPVWFCGVVGCRTFTLNPLVLRAASCWFVCLFVFIDPWGLSGWILMSSAMGTLLFLPFSSGYFYFHFWACCPGCSESRGPCLVLNLDGKSVSLLSQAPPNSMPAAAERPRDLGQTVPRAFEALRDAWVLLNKIAKDIGKFQKSLSGECPWGKRGPESRWTVMHKITRWHSLFPRRALVWLCSHQWPRIWGGPFSITWFQSSRYLTRISTFAYQTREHFYFEGYSVEMWCVF